MWPRRSHILAPLAEASSVPKGIKILWCDALESCFKILNCIVSAETLLGFPYWTVPFIVHNGAYDIQLCAVISHSNKPISFLSRILSKPQRNYITNEKELLVIVE